MLAMSTDSTSIPVDRDAPRVPMHPGGSLADALEDRGGSVEHLVASTPLTRPQVEEIIREERPITPVVALYLARYFGTSAEFWLNLQTRYDLDTARAEFGDLLASVRPLPAV